MPRFEWTRPELYINDSNNYRIREVSNGLITTVAGNGTAASSGDGGLAIEAAMLPAGMAFDSAGDLFVSDSGRIREISGGMIHTIAGTGTPGDSADYLPALTAALNPGALLVDAAGRSSSMASPLPCSTRSPCRSMRRRRLPSQARRW